MHADARFSGFCVGGYNWPRAAMSTATQPEDALAVRRQLAAEDARLTRELGGNLIRVFWSVESLLRGDPDDLAAALNAMIRGDLHHRCVYLEDLETRMERLDRADVVLDQLLRALSGEDAPVRLVFDELDAMLGGVADANRDGAPVSVLLSLVIPPPRYIVECPSDATLQGHGRGYRFRSLWDKYVRIHEALHRTLLTRYVVERPNAHIRAFELGNEPDYEWTPEEMKIERGGSELVYPLAKYVTELHWSQVPDGQESAPAFERTASGFFQHQDGPWARRVEPTPFLEFDWGAKFAWYVACFADLQARVAHGLKREADERGVEVITVAASVTHNNIDYLLRMHRANRDAFTWIDKIGLHPYHWLRHDVWDEEFVCKEAFDGWAAANPRHTPRS